MEVMLFSQFTGVHEYTQVLAKTELAEWVVN